MSNSAAAASTAGPAPSVVAAPVAPVRAAATLTSFDQQLLSMINAKRKAAGLVTLTAATGLTNLSKWWSTQMASGKTDYQLKHNPNATAMLANYGASNWTSWSENVARWKPSSITAAAIFDAYWASPGHRANILGAKSRYIGVASVTGSAGWTFNTMTFTDKVESGQIAVKPASAEKPRAKGRVDRVSVVDGTIRVTGWAFSPNRPDKSNTVRITITVNGKSTSYLRATPKTRPDVNAAQKITGKHGFVTNLPLKAGSNKVCVTSVAFPGAISTALGCTTVKG